VYEPTQELMVMKELKDYEETEYINQFIDEIRLCCQLIHPNIIK